MKKLKVEKTVLPRHQLKDSVLIVKVGSDERPAEESDLNNIRTILEAALSNYSGWTALVTHHCISFETLSLTGLKNKPKEVDKDQKKANKRLNGKNPALFGMKP